MTLVVSNYKTSEVHDLIERLRKRGVGRRQEGPTLVDVQAPASACGPLPTEHEPRQHADLQDGWLNPLLRVRRLRGELEANRTPG